ncbi:MAG: hypothetical protein OXK20_01965 [Deltaproteobacteria bacterium]|nr:hypothetical protein [Deltaproteobacteria bacterium]
MLQGELGAALKNKIIVNNTFNTRLWKPIHRLLLKVSGRRNQKEGHRGIRRETVALACPEPWTKDLPQGADSRERGQESVTVFTSLEVPGGTHPRQGAGHRLPALLHGLRELAAGRAFKTFL